jgi:leucyl aminopeptidase
MLELIVSADNPPLPFERPLDLLALACFEDRLAEDPLVRTADEALGGVLRQAITDERFKAKPNQALTLHTQGKLRPTRLVLLGCGPSGNFGAKDLRPAAARTARVAAAAGAKSAGLATSWNAPDPAAAVAAAAEGALLGLYRFDKYLTGERRTPVGLAAVTLFVPGAGDEVAAPALARARETGRAVGRARDLVNEPAGYLTPSRLAAAAEEWAREGGLAVEVLDRAACGQLGMGLYLAVAQGSVEEPRFIHLAWKPKQARRRIVLVGKGVTFDSGGLSLKTNDGMLDMKTDMAGAAAVIAAAAAVAAEKLPVELHAIAAATENMPSGSSYKLGDVLRSMAGKTVEINNTDAEGRLTLADALTFGLRLEPDAVFDFATLTGACVVALGPHTAGVMSNNDGLAAEWLAAAGAAGEDMWRLPLPPRLADQLKSEVADMKNTGERWGGALTAGLFLREFVGETPWVHVDLAGPASTDKELGHVGKGGTGFAVATILEFLRRIASRPEGRSEDEDRGFSAEKPR